MKYVLALFLMFMFLQPSGLQACSMDSKDISGHHAEMNHSAESDCCDSSPSEPMGDCEPAMQCGFVSSLVPAVQPSPGSFLLTSGHHYDMMYANHYTGPPAKPLFRPPIA